MADTSDVTSAVLAHAPLLVTESQEEYTRIWESLTEEINPRGTIESMYVAEIAQTIWEIRRLGRCKTAVINSSFRIALEKIITQMLREPGSLELGLKGDAEAMARHWFVDSAYKKEIADLLKKFGLDESAIEAEAMRQVADDLERLERLIRFAQARRDRALVCIAQYRGDFGDKLRKSSAKLIEHENVAPARPPKQRPAA